MEITPVIERLILGGVFAYASFDKILRPLAFAEEVYNYQRLPDRLINLSAIVLPWMELVLGFLMISGLWQPGAAFLCAGLLSAFLAGLVFNTDRGLHITCGCFIASSEAASTAMRTWYVIRDAALLLIALSLLRLVARGDGLKFKQQNS